jgi:hypothetical protein
VDRRKLKGNNDYAKNMNCTYGNPDDKMKRGKVRNNGGGGMITHHCGTFLYLAVLTICTVPNVSRAHNEHEMDE